MAENCVHVTKFARRMMQSNCCALFLYRHSLGSWYAYLFVHRISMCVCIFYRIASRYIPSPLYDVCECTRAFAAMWFQMFSPLENVGEKCEFLNSPKLSRTQFPTVKSLTWSTMVLVIIASGADTAKQLRFFSSYKYLGWHSNNLISLALFIHKCFLPSVQFASQSTIYHQLSHQDILFRPHFTIEIHFWMY